jgi:hypothetical protein
MIRFIASLQLGSPELPIFCQKLRWLDGGWRQEPVLARIDYLEPTFEGFAEGHEGAWMIAQGFSPAPISGALLHITAIGPIPDGTALCLHRHMKIGGNGRYASSPSRTLLTDPPPLGIPKRERFAEISLAPDIYWLVYELTPRSFPGA